MTSQKPPDNQDERISRIEHGLLLESTLLSEIPERKTLLERLDYYRVPGLSVAVINDSKLEWARGYGVRETGNPLSVEPDTLFQAGSISKPVAAAAALRLVEAGQLDLDEDVNKFLTSWKVPTNAGWQPRLTLRQLLSHSAGLTVHGFPGYARTDNVPTLLQVLDGTTPANTPAIRVDTVPGLMFRYSGGGYCVLQQMLIDVTGKPFPELMRELILDPLRMEHSTYEQPLPQKRATKAAMGYYWMNTTPVGGKYHVYPEMAAAGLWTTPSDLARFTLEIQLSKAGKPNLILSAEMVNQMLTPQVEEHRELQMGLGLALFSKGKTTRFGHSGMNMGFTARIEAFRDRGFGAAVMTNGHRGSELCKEVFHAIALEYGWPEYLPKEYIPIEVAPSLGAAYAGTYEQHGVTFTVEQLREQVLLLHSPGQAPLPLYPDSETSYFARAANASVRFVLNEVGQVTELILKQNGRELPAKRLGF
jgi:CubicO group peptidase (beta-lactamase class C family)